MDVKELRDLVRIVQVRRFDQIDRRRRADLLFGVAMEASPAAASGDAISHPTVDLAFDPGDTALGDRHRRREATVANVGVQGAAAEASSCLDLTKTNEGRSGLHVFGRHGFHPCSTGDGWKMVRFENYK
jgi:hypothetical protein